MQDDILNDIEALTIDLHLLEKENQKLREEIELTYDKGFNDGYDSGLREGEGNAATDAYEDGYDTGFEDGLAEAGHPTKENI